MKYSSTRGLSSPVSPSEAIIAGLAPDGGLYIPEEIPSVSMEDIAALCKADYAVRSAEVLSRFLTDYTKEELLGYTRAAYAPDRFTSPDGAAPVVRIGQNEYVLELFHGPSCAFKDFALQLLPRLLTAAMRKNGRTETVIILVATSGDTGKAALEGFHDVPGTRICVFYPDGGTSAVQKLQMTTQAGSNVMVAAVRGNFDDAQTGVKKIFSDKTYAEELNKDGYVLSSANSINWGRLAPQIAYYFSAYCDLVNAGEIVLGAPVDFCVPTGNFGNILAAHYAKLCGLPVRRLICASNENRVLTDFINTGVYDRNREFHLTRSPSMDILISSNLERLLRLLSGSAEEVRGYMDALAACGRYRFSPAAFAALQQEFRSGCATDAETMRTIGELYRERNYLTDTHTAVAVKVLEDLGERDIPVIIDATASPFKFSGSVLEAIGQPVPADEFAALAALSEASGISVPTPLLGLNGRVERFTDVVDKEEMRQVVDRLRK